MRFSQVERVLDALDARGVRCWVAGGWGVAALIGRQSRPHRDLDLVIDHEDLDACRSVLEGLGYTVETDWLPTRVEMALPPDAWVDVHPLRFQQGGRASLPLPDGTAMDYPPGVFTTGMLRGRVIPCLSAEQQRAVHRGYEPKGNDLHDLAQLDRLRDRERVVRGPGPRS